jgi:hypothetical protein
MEEKYESISPRSYFFEECLVIESVSSFEIEKRMLFCAKKSAILINTRFVT